MLVFRCKSLHFLVSSQRETLVAPQKLTKSHVSSKEAGFDTCTEFSLRLRMPKTDKGLTG